MREWERESERKRKRQTQDKIQPLRHNLRNLLPLARPHPTS
jgi:hypothetical protein